ncbi:S8 family serine peptidase [Catellatospora sp. NPDC049111]|uniref:S8 family serine peptidase n=1 Tax=Catellatospora sp. NPDC049111 TaxID=3155271 RepID=UPI0033C72273
MIGALVATALLGSGLAGLSGSAVAAPPTTEPTARYLVQLDGEPLATYAGGEAGFAATKPAAGAKLNRTSGGAQAYRGHLRREQEQVLKDAGVPQDRPRVTLDTAFNGFAMELTRSQALRLRATRGVRAVYDNRKVHTMTSHTPDYLGLTGRDGVWREQFGGVSRAGEGVIVGVIDSGFWPESASFAPLPTPRPDQAVIDAKWRGTCDVGMEAPVTCNNKVIGARWYNDSGIAEAFPDEFSSPRDRNGHGTHTASTAAGLYGVPAKAGTEDLGRISGMAPAARLAVYKALYDTGEGGATGTEIDIVHAIDDAVADGVDVINYSVGDDSEYFGAIDAAFFNAAAAGVFVSAAAGNAGPHEGTVDNSTPWVTTVAASTTDRMRARTLTLGDGAVLIGAGLGGSGVGPVRLVSAKDSALDPNDAYNAERCVDGTLDPAKVTGAIVVCLRGDIARTDKSLTVARAGGVGMVLYNDELGSLSADTHSVPTVHIDEVDGARVLAYLATGAATATLSAATVKTVESPSVAAFSSAGPSNAVIGELRACTELADRPREHARACLNWAQGALHAGYLEQAATLLADGRELVAQTGYERLSALVEATALSLDRAEGRLSGLAERFTRLIAATERMPVTTLDARAELATVLAMTAGEGDAEAAERALGEVIAEARRVGAVWPLVQALSAAARLLLDRRPDEAVWHATEAVSLVRGKGIWAWAADAVLVLAEAAVAAGEPARAAATIAELAAGLAGRDTPVAAAVLRRCRELVPE